MWWVFMNITFHKSNRHVKRLIWVACYVPSKEEESQKIWFGYIDKSKSGKATFNGARKPTSQSASGYTKEEALKKLVKYLDSAYRGWEQYNDFKRFTACIEDVKNYV